MNYRNTPEALLWSHLTSEVPLKDLLTGKLPYYWYTAVIYAHSERQANGWKSDLGCIAGWKIKAARVFVCRSKGSNQLHKCYQIGNTVVRRRCDFCSRNKLSHGGERKLSTWGCITIKLPPSASVSLLRLVCLGLVSCDTAVVLVQFEILRPCSLSHSPDSRLRWFPFIIGPAGLLFCSAWVNSQYAMFLSKLLSL